MRGSKYFWAVYLIMLTLAGAVLGLYGALGYAVAERSSTPKDNQIDCASLREKDLQELERYRSFTEDVKLLLHTAYSLPEGESFDESKIYDINQRLLNFNLNSGGDIK